MDRDIDSRPLPELVAEATRQARLLFRQEIALARAELAEKISQASRAAAMLGAGGFLAYAGLLVLLAALVLWLSALGLSTPAAALIVGLVCLAGGGLLLRIGLSGLRPSALAPTATVETLKESVESLKGTR